MSQRCRMHVRWGGELPRSQPFGGTRTPSQQAEPIGENAYGFAALLQAMQMLPYILPAGEDAAPVATASAPPAVAPNGGAGVGFPHQAAGISHKPESGLGQALTDSPLGIVQPAVPQASGPETSQASPIAEVLVPEGGQGEAQARFTGFAPPSGADGLQGLHAGAFSAVVAAGGAVGSEQGSSPTLQGITGTLETQLRALFLQELMRSAAAGRGEHPPAVAHMRVELPQWGTLALSVAVAEDSVRVQAETESSELGRTLGSNAAELERMLAGRQLRLELLEVRVRSSEMGFSGGSLPHGNSDAREYQERRRFVSSFQWHRGAAAAAQTSQDVTPSTGAVNARG